MVALRAGLGLMASVGLFPAVAGQVVRALPLVAPAEAPLGSAVEPVSGDTRTSGRRDLPAEHWLYRLAGTMPPDPAKRTAADHSAAELAETRSAVAEARLRLLALELEALSAAGGGAASATGATGILGAADTFDEVLRKFDDVGSAVTASRVGMGEFNVTGGRVAPEGVEPEAVILDVPAAD